MCVFFFKDCCFFSLSLLFSQRFSSKVWAPNFDLRRLKVFILIRRKATVKICWARTLTFPKIVFNALSVFFFPLILSNKMHFLFVFSYFLLVLFGPLLLEKLENKFRPFNNSFYFACVHRITLKLKSLRPLA